VVSVAYLRRAPLINAGRNGRWDAACPESSVPKQQQQSQQAIRIQSDHFPIGMTPVIGTATPDEASLNREGGSPGWKLEGESWRKGCPEDA